MVAPVRKIMISNGEEFFEISPTDLEAARGEGFYVPGDHGLALVTDGQDILEIPIDDLADAEAEGFRRLDSSGRKRLAAQTSPAPNRVRGGVSIPAVRITTDDVVEPVDLSAVSLVSSEPAAEVVAEPVVIEADDDAIDSLAADEVAELAEVTEATSDAYDEEEAELRRQQEEELEEASGLRWCWLYFQYRVLPDEEVQREFLTAYGASAIICMSVLIGLSLIVFSKPELQDGGAILSSVIENPEESREEEETPEIEIEEITEVDETVTETADAVGDISDSVGLKVTKLSSPVGVSTGGGLEGVENAAGESVKAPASFFGAKTVASRFVFVIDNSNSMTKGRFETALNELAKTLESLNENQSYYILFYSDTAYGLFHPYAVSDLIPATKKNKIATLKWLLTVQLCLRTDAAEAIQKALELEPDVIFVLGDGAFTDAQAVQKVVRARTEDQKKIKINALGMEVNANAAKNFTFLAQESGGTYNDVGVHPVGAEIAQRNPRPKNNKRGPIWGIKLPPK